MLNRKGFLEAKIGLIEKEFLCRPQGVQRRLQHLQTDFNGAVQESACINNLIDQTDPVGLAGIDDPSGEAEITRQTAADNPFQGCEEGRSAELDFRMAK